MTNRILPTQPSSTKAKLLDATTRLVREKGFSSTSVDDLCKAAGVTKGAFFHHFASKDALGVAAANHWSDMTSAIFAQAPYHKPAEPLDRLFAYLDFRAALIAGGVAEFTCLVGTMVQEVHETSPAIRAACNASITRHAETLVPDVAAALKAHRVEGIDPHGLALHTQAVLQGAFILAKARGTDGGGPEAARKSTAHLKRYFQLLFATSEENEPCKPRK